MAKKAETIPQPPKQCGIHQSADKAIRLPAVLQLTGKSKTATYDDIRDGRFPAGFLIGRRARAWMLSEVMGWLESRRAGVEK